MFGVDHDDEVAAIRVRGEVGLVLADEHGGDARRQAAERLTFCVDDEPLPLGGGVFSQKRGAHEMSCQKETLPRRGGTTTIIRERGRLRQVSARVSTPVPHGGSGGGGEHLPIHLATSGPTACAATRHKTKSTTARPIDATPTTVRSTLDMGVVFDHKEATI